MSLINEALKKAQKQRTGEAPTLASMPAIGGESARHIARRAKPASFNTLLIRLGLGGAGLVIVLVVGVLLLRKSPAPAEPTAVAQTAPPVQTAPTTPPAATASTPASAPAQTAPAETVFVLPVAPPPATEKATAVIPQPEPKAATPLPAAPVAQPAAPTSEPVRAPAPPGRLEPRAIAYIDNIRVAGIRASATDSKVLMNDRVYRIGDTVEHEMRLKLVGITSSSLTFEDMAGGQYTRNF